MPKDENTLNIFSFLDYRLYLKTYIENRQLSDKSFSIRKFEKELGMGAFGLLSKILNGKRNISLKLSEIICKVIDLNIQETKYFLDLVKYNQAKKLPDKDYHFKNLLNLTKTPIQIKTKDQYKYYSKWYHIAIRALLDTYNFTSDYHALSRKLVPRIRPDQAKSAIAILKKLGLIEKNEKGYYKPTNKTISTGSDREKSVSINNFQKAVISLAKDSIDRIPKEKRNISTLTFSVDQRTIELMNKKIEVHRKEIVELAGNAENTSVVYQYNLNLFPLSKVEENDNT